MIFSACPDVSDWSWSMAESVLGETAPELFVHRAQSRLPGTILALRLQAPPVRKDPKQGIRRSPGTSGPIPTTKRQARDSLGPSIGPSKKRSNSGDSGLDTYR